MKNSTMYRASDRWPWLLAFILWAAWSQAAHASDSFVPCYRMGRIKECVAVPLAGAEEDAEAKLFRAPPADRGKIYIFRESTVAPNRKSSIFFDGEPVTDIAPMSFTVLEAVPGMHRLATGGEHGAEREVKLEAGKILYMENTFSLLFFTMSEALQPADEQKARASILRLKLVKPASQAK